MLPCRCPLRSVAVRSIQKTIQVTKPVAMIESNPPMVSWAAKLSPWVPKVRTAPSVRASSTASPTPAQMRGSTSRRPILTT